MTLYPSSHCRVAAHFTRAREPGGREAMSRLAALGVPIAGGEQPLRLAFGAEPICSGERPR